MVDAEIVREWISKADEDFEFALSTLREGKTSYSQICSHFQQASEKYLRSFIIARELEFRKIHDLPLLLKISSSKDPSLEEIREDCEYLNPFYVDTRYPVIVIITTMELHARLRPLPRFLNRQHCCFWVRG